MPDLISLSTARRFLACLAAVTLSAAALPALAPTSGDGCCGEQKEEEAAAQQPELPALGLPQTALRCGRQQAFSGLLECLPAIRPLVWWHATVSPERGKPFVRSRDRRVWTF